MKGDSDLIMDHIREEMNKRNKAVRSMIAVYSNKIIKLSEGFNSYQCDEFFNKIELSETRFNNLTVYYEDYGASMFIPKKD